MRTKPGTALVLIYCYCAVMVAEPPWNSVLVFTVHMLAGIGALVLVAKLISRSVKHEKALDIAAPGWDSEAK